MKFCHCVGAISATEWRNWIRSPAEQRKVEEQERGGRTEHLTLSEKINFRNTGVPV